MLSKTLQDGLNDYGIGARIRALRLKKKIGPTLLRIALVFGVGLGYFFAGAREKLRPHDHAGVEFIYVIEGTLSVHMNGEEHVLEAGDAIDFDATTPHAYRRSGGRLCER